jgi:hypothetical protein
MKRLYTLLLVLLPLALSAQTARESLMADIQENIFRAGMNMDPYEYIPGPQTPAPKGYKPFYISHYGRHGSRSNWGGKPYADISARYHRAFDAGLLTAEGKAAMEQIDELIRLHDNMDGRLTYLGTQEHRQIARRMYQNYKPVFHNGSKKITARSSTVQRVIVSMAAFTGELMEQEKGLDIHWDTGEELMKILSTDSNRAARDSVKKIQARQALENMPDTAAFLQRIFTDPAAARPLTGNPVSLMQQTFNMAVGCAAFELDDRLFRLFSWDELYAYQQSLAMSFYLRQCNSIEFGDERMKVLDPLMHDIIEKADAAIATGEYAADLRFGHDYQLLALSSRLGLKGVAERLDQETCKDWPGWRYTPFAGNVQLIFYKDKKGNVLVKPLLNERETPIIGLEGFPYYKWEDVKAYLNAQFK